MAVLTENYWQSFVGETIRGNTAWSNVYHIQKFLGRGAYGGVFKAQQDDTKQLVAVKLMLPADEGAREIKTALKVPPHPNLIKHFEAIEVDLKGTPMYVLVMELADGGSLRDLLNQRILNGVEVKKIALDIVEGLKHLHSIDATGSEEQKRVHRDMKPENVLQVKGVWKIADFGLAKVLENGSMQASKTAGGTPQYMPPELLQRPNIVSTKWDIWSFGVILAEMIARERPFDSSQPDADERENEIYRKILAAKPNIPNVPKEWIPIVEGCLVKKHKSRWAAVDVLRALDSIKQLDIQSPIIHEEGQTSQQKTQRISTSSRTNNHWVMALTIGVIVGGICFWLTSKPPTPSTNSLSTERVQPVDSNLFSFNNPLVMALAVGAVVGGISFWQTSVLLVLRGDAKYALGDKQGAIADYNEVIRLKPDYAYAYNNRGLAKCLLGDKQGAIADYNESIRLGSKDVHIDYTNRGVAKDDLGDKQGAIADYNEAIRLKPDYAYAYYGRGIAKKDLGDKQGAIADYKEAIRLNHRLASAYYNRGDTYQNLGEKQKALADFREASSLYQQQGKTSDYNDAEDRIRKLGGQ
ncbi:MAG: protein kinase domain-containing protein [Pseudanabaena sp.]